MIYVVDDYSLVVSTDVASGRHAALYLAAEEGGGHVALHVLGLVVPPCGRHGGGSGDGGR